MINCAIIKKSINIQLIIVIQTFDFLEYLIVTSVFCRDLFCCYTDNNETFQPLISESFLLWNSLVSYGWSWINASKALHTKQAFLL